MSTLTDLQAELALYVTARNKILSGQEISIDKIHIRRANLKDVERRIQEINMQIARINGTNVTYPLFRGSE